MVSVYYMYYRACFHQLQPIFLGTYYKLASMFLTCYWTEHIGFIRFERKYHTTLPEYQTHVHWKPIISLTTLILSLENLIWTSEPIAASQNVTSHTEVRLYRWCFWALNFLVCWKKTLKKTFLDTSVSFYQSSLSLRTTRLPEGMRKVLVLLENDGELESRREACLLYLWARKKARSIPINSSVNKWRTKVCTLSWLQAH